MKNRQINGKIIKIKIYKIYKIQLKVQFKFQQVLISKISIFYKINIQNQRKNKPSNHLNSKHPPTFHNKMGNSQDFTQSQSIMKGYFQYQKHFNQINKVHNVQDIKFPLSTSGATIVDRNNKRVKLAGTNWSGGHMARHCVDGLQCRPLKDIALDIRDKFKMNCIRLTYSLQLFYDNNVIPDKFLQANPELKGKTAMEIFDYTIKVLTQIGLMVILNNHTSKSQWCCSNDDGDGLWWSRQYPEYMFFQCAQHFAQRYKSNPLVIGMDLRNQLRKAHGDDTKWGNKDPKTDWRRAAKICADKVQKIAPDWLIFVSAINYQLDLTDVEKYPLQLTVPNKLVYTGHFYGWSWPIPSWQVVSYQQFKKKFFNTQTFVRGKGIPYFIGEFGNNKRDIPWNYLIQYLQQTDIDWTYWCCDGFKCVRNDDQTFGLFTNDFKNIRNQDIYEDLMKIVPRKD